MQVHKRKKPTNLIFITWLIAHFGNFPEILVMQKLLLFMAQQYGRKPYSTPEGHTVQQNFILVQQNSIQYSRSQYSATEDQQVQQKNNQYNRRPYGTTEFNISTIKVKIVQNMAIRYKRSRYGTTEGQTLQK